MRLLLATRNEKKLAELRRILAASPSLRDVELIGLDDVAAYPEAPETGLTFAENALLKAREGVKHTGLPTVADDSGLSVHAVQDAYSMRCAPQVAGAARDTLHFALTVAGRELVSVADNPVVLPDGRVESTGNFHGAPLGFAADYLAIAAAEVGSISERRVDRLLDVCRSRDLPAFLTPDPGVNSGLMIAQYTAAGIVADNRRLAAPASVDSVPTSGMQEDHVSMGWAATKKLRVVLDNLTSILAVELLAAVRGLQLRAPLSPSPAGRLALSAVSAFAGTPGPDVFLAPVLEQTRALVAGRDLRTEIESAVGPLS